MLHTCLRCGIEFQGAANALRCPACKKAIKNEQIKEIRHRNSPTEIRYNGSEDICQICGKPYIVNGGRQLYCTNCIPRVPTELQQDPMTKQILSMWHGGFTVNTIAKHLGLSHQKVRRVLIVLGLYTSATIQQVRKLSDSGKTVDEIATELGCSRKNVLSMLPYDKVSYKQSTPTANAARLRNWRKQKKKG